MEHQFDARLETSGAAGEQLNHIENELKRICAALGFTMERMPDRSGTVVPVSFRPALPSVSDGGRERAEQFRRSRARTARQEIKRRRQRERFFPADMLADPAWDVLLDLYAAHYERREISVSSACIAAAVPATTALRWLKSMCDAGLIHRLPDETDGRRIFVAISEQSRTQMDAYFDEIDE